MTKIWTRFVAPRSRIGSAAFFAAFLFLVAVPCCRADSIQKALEDALSGAPKTTAACAVAVPSGDVVYSLHAQELVKPASIQKLITTDAVFETFGPESEFVTEVFGEPSAARNLSVLYLRGLGDPSLTTETLWILARAVRRHGIAAIEKLVFDDSAFDGIKARSGERAYMGGASALAVNFNAFGVTACPTSAGHAAILSIDPLESGFGVKGSVATVEHGEPGLQISEPDAQSVVVRGKVMRNGGCFTLNRSAADPASLAAEMFRKYLSYLGIHVPEHAQRGEVPVRAELIEWLRSKPLHEIVWGMNHYSTNVTAEQLLMALGGDENRKLDDLPLGSRLKHERALHALAAFARVVSPAGATPTFVDGSGLDRDNRAPAKLFCDLLGRVARNPNINIEFENSLGASGRSGTLARRSFDLPQGVVRAKTGTLDNVSSLSGYLVSAHGTKYAFTIVQNSQLTKAEAVRFEDRFVRALYHEGD